MRNRWLLVLAALGLSATVMALEPTEVEYSADQTMETAEISMEGPVYVAPGMERRETLIEGMRQITIVRHDKGVMWTLMPEERMYMEAKLAAAGTGQGDLSGYEVEQTTVGEERVNGIMTTKSKIMMTGKDGGKMGGFWWMSTEGILVKMDVIAIDKGSKGRIKKELKNVRIGSQDPALFEIPKGYTQMSLMNFMMGGGGESQQAEEGSTEEAKPAEAKKEKRGFGLKSILDMAR